MFGALDKMLVDRDPPAPKVLRRGSLAASDMDKLCQTRAALAWGVFLTQLAAKPKMSRFNPTWLQNGLHSGPTSANKAPTSAQIGPNMMQLGPQLGGRKAQLALACARSHVWLKLGGQVGANRPEFAASRAQVGPKLAPVRPNLAPVTFWPFPCVSNSLGAGGSHREATRIL